MQGKEEDQNNILKTFQDCIGVYDEISSPYFCRPCARKISHIRDKIAELRELSKRKKEERCKRGIHDSSPDRSVVVPLSEKAMVSTPPKARICLAKKFQHIAPKPPPTATTTSERSEEHLVMTGTGNESVETVTTTKMKPRVLPTFLQPRRNEGADVLTTLDFMQR